MATVHFHNTYVPVLLLNAVVSAMEAPPPPVALREDNVPDDLICSICMTVPTEPLLTPCDHLFCRTCIRQALDNQNLCPIDRQPCSRRQLRPLDGLISRVWGGIQVKCGCHESGCIWTGSIADYSAHLESCSVYSNSNSALRHEIARLKEQLEEKDEEITSLQTRLIEAVRNDALRNNLMDERRYLATRDNVEPHLRRAQQWMSYGLQQDTLDTIKRLGLTDVDMGANISDIINSLQKGRSSNSGSIERE